MKNSESNRRGIVERARVFARSLLIGAAWNYSRMQNIGFIYAIIPGAGKCGKKRNDLLARHTESFSTNPYMATLIVASALKYEETYQGTDALRIKQSLAGPYAALGDPFFWGALRPLSAILGVCIAVCGSILAPMVALIFYNVFHGYIRIKGFVMAYRDGAGGMEFLRKLDMPRNGVRLRWLSVFFLACLTGILLPLPVSEHALLFSGTAESLLVLGGIAVCFWLLALRVPVLVILYGLSIIICFVAGIVCE